MKHAFTQVSRHYASSSSQTIYHRRVNKATSYEIVTSSNYDEKDLLDSLKKVSPLFEEALQDNEAVDIFADYLDIPEKGDTSIFRRAEEDEAVKALGNYAELNFGGFGVHDMDVHPIENDIIAVSLCHAAPTVGVSSPAYIVGWRLGHQSSQFILRSPEDCFVFRFNPSQPNLIVGGCRNGTVALWDTLQAADQHEIGEGKVAIEPTLLSHPENGPKRTVGDLCWLPPDIHINAQGQLLQKDLVSEHSFQFFCVSGDGQIHFWDVRFKEIMEGKLPHIAKVKPSSKQTFEADDGFPIVKWLPLFKIKPKRLEGSGELSLCRALFPAAKDQVNFKFSQIIVSSEEGDLLSVDWCPKAKEETVPDQNREFASQEYVTWMTKDHNRPCFSLALSPFFHDFVLTVSDWNFHLWQIKEGTGNVPVFSSTISESLITGGIWSPTRPGVIYITKIDGTIAVWDFMIGCYEPHSSIPLIPNSINTVDFASSASNPQILAVGDDRGVLHMFELPRHFVHPYPHEEEHMRQFLDRETKCKSMRVEQMNEKAEDSSESNGENKSITMSQGLTDEEEALYAEMERDFIAS